MLKIIETNKVSQPNGHYAQAIEVNGFIYTSILLGVTFDGNSISFEEQLTTILKNIEIILIEGGSNLTKVVKLSVFLTDIKDWDKANAIISTFFNSHKPTRGILAVPHLHLQAKVAAEVIAVK